MTAPLLVFCIKTRERPSVFVQNNLLILPLKNGVYAILQEEEYIGISEITV